MNKFEQYLINIGIHFQTAGKYGKTADKYLQWLAANNLKVKSIKRSQFTEWIQECRKNGNKVSTIRSKEIVIKHYYNFLGNKNNPAVSWIKTKKTHTLPPTALSKEELKRIYDSFKPKSPAEYRNRCMMGMVLFQGMRREELQEVRISDIDFDNGSVFVQGQRKTNSRHLKLEASQTLHLHYYFHKYRKDFLAIKTNQETDKFFLSKGEGCSLHSATSILMKKLIRQFPQVDNLLHIRGSVITHWQKELGIMEAMVNAGHRYISSTQRYQTNKYEQLQDQLRTMHPLEHLNLSNS